MKKVFALALACALLLSAANLALAEIAEPGSTITLEFPYSGAKSHLVHAQYTLGAGLTFGSGEITGVNAGLSGGKAGKSEGIFASIPGVTSGSLKLTVKVNADAAGDLAVTLTSIRGYAPGGWVDLTGAGAKTITVSESPVGEMPGDATGDNKVNHLDLTAIVLHVLDGKAIASTQNADANGDGKINHLDLTAIVLYVLDGKPMR